MLWLALLTFVIEDHPALALLGVAAVLAVLLLGVVSAGAWLVWRM